MFCSLFYQHFEAGGKPSPNPIWKHRADLEIPRDRNRKSFYFVPVLCSLFGFTAELRHHHRDLKWSDRGLFMACYTRWIDLFCIWSVLCAVLHVVSRLEVCPALIRCGCIKLEWAHMAGKKKTSALLSQMAALLLINFLLIQYEMMKCGVGWVVCGVSSKQCVITSVLRLAWEIAFMIQKRGWMH